MKKSLLAVVCVIAFCGLLTLPLSLQSALFSSHILSPTSQATTQSTPQSPSPSTLQTDPKPTSQNTQSTTVLPALPQNTPVNTSQGSQQLGPQPTPPSVQQPTNRTLQEAVGNATNYLAQTRDPYALLMLNILYRRFGITEFADTLQRFDQLLAKNPDNAPLLRIFRRIADYNNPLQPMDPYAVTVDVDQITVPALYSDRSSLPEDYPSKLIDAANSGGYLLTHALLATIWLHDNNYERPISYDFTEFVYQANAGLIGSGGVVNDIEVEAAAFLFAAGQGNLVSDAFVQRVIATQNLDGGWSFSSDTPDGSFWHTSVLALMLLLHVEFPATSYTPMIASAPSYDNGCLNPLAVCFIAVWLIASINVKKKTMQLNLRQQPSQQRLM